MRMWKKTKTGKTMTVTMTIVNLTTGFSYVKANEK